MKRNVILATLAVALLTAAPSWAAQPFGSFGGKVGGGNSGAGLIPIHGWALDDDGVEAVDILVDGVVVGRTTYGRSRPQVARQHPGFPDSAAAGFAFQLDTTHFLNGRHTVTAQVRSRTGEVRNLNSRAFQFLNTTHALAPFGALEFPQQNAELFGACDLDDPRRRYSVIMGYALDAGIQADDHGVGYVELLIDRARWANSKTSCVHDPDRGGPSDCYGLRRLDVERFFPRLRDAPHSGFRFVLDIGLLLNLGYGPGHHTLLVRAGDLFGTVRNIAEIPVTFTCAEFEADDLSFGDISTPLGGLLYSGTITTLGWALDFDGIAAIEVLVDGAKVGFATPGFSAPNISLTFPGFPESAAPGWRFSLDTRLFSNGPHDLQILVTDDKGIETFIGERRFQISNPPGS